MQQAGRRILDLSEAAKLLLCKKSWLYDHIKVLGIPHFRLGQRLIRFYEDELMRWIEQQTDCQ